MTNASVGKVMVNRQREMAVYDALPLPLRCAFQNADQNYSVIAFAEALIGGTSVQACIDELGASDRFYRQTARRPRRG